MAFFLIKYIYVYIAGNYIYILYHVNCGNKLVNLFVKLEIDEIEVFVDITSPTFNIANLSRGLSGLHWQQTLLMAEMISIVTKIM